MEKPYIGVTGQVGSGKTEIATYFADHGYTPLSLSDILRREADARKLPHTRVNLINIGNELRQSFGPRVLGERTVERIKTDRIERAVVESVRFPDEVRALRSGLDITMLGVVMDPERQFALIQKRNREGDPRTYDDFVRSLQDSTEESILECLEMVDHMIPNNGTLQELHQKLSHLRLF